MKNAKMSRARSLILCAIAYAAAAVAAMAAARLLGRGSPIIEAAAGDVAATIVVFAFSLALDNSSMYDPYWSVAPVPIAIYWLLSLGNGLNARRIVLLALVLLWAARLTFNWVRRWKGLADEDFRYADYRRFGAAYWPISFLGFHFFPTVIVFLGCLSLVPALSAGSRAIGVLDLVAAAVTLAAIGVETGADRQLRRFLVSPRVPGQILDNGLWSLSRHPNYFGEVLFWWGVYLFGLAAHPGWWWTIIGPVAITGLFLGISVPMMDKRMLSRHPDYAEHMAIRSGFIPWPPRRTDDENITEDT
jgi:steroid 5-alpha reductase family enzyme